ncbi:MAG: hypothetical protein DMG26_02155 [Acidobacteria bacterium]|nr:MAG: hypothetical protein DMG26_02155 [Acidobacteriota bacterium]
MTDQERPNSERLKQEATALSKSLGKALAGLPAALAEIVTLSPIVLGIALIALGAWWYEHGGRLKQAGQLHELEKQTAANISELRAHAAAIGEANQGRARRIVELETARQKSERGAAALHQRLLALQADQQAQARQVAALPTPEVARRVAARLGLGPGDVETRGSGFGIRGSDETRDSGFGIRDSGRKNLDLPNPESRLPTPGFSLSEAALRKVETALVELDGCKQQAQVEGSLIGNCKEQAAASASIIDQQKASLAGLNQALADKDRILAASQQQQKAELKIARGAFSQRLVRTLEHVAIGVAIGLAVRR